MPPAANRKVVRHFAGKRAGSEDLSEFSEDEYSEEGEQDQEQESRGGSGIRLNIGSIEIKEGPQEQAEPQSSEDEYATDEKHESKQTVLDQDGPPQDASHEQNESESESENSGSGDSESESEEEQVLVRPKFIPKNKRGLIKSKVGDELHREKPGSQTKERTMEMIEQTVRQEKAQRLAHKNAGSSLADDEVQAVDDTDGIDPEGEYLEWKEREKARMKRDRDIIVQEELAQEAAEELRAMSEHDRQKLHETRTREKDEAKTNEPIKESTHYYHRGAFFQDDELVKSRDFSANVEDTYKDYNAVPASLRQTNRTGQKGQRRHIPLRDQDTSEQSGLKRHRAS